MKNVGNNSHGRSQGVPKIFRAPMYRAHCAVIFAIAQLSCITCCHISHVLIPCIEQNSQTSERLKLNKALDKNSSLSYGTSPAIWDHTVLPATRHK